MLERDLSVSHAAVFHPFGTALRTGSGDGGVREEEGKASAVAIRTVYGDIRAAEAVGEEGARRKGGFQLFVALPLAGIL